MNIDVTSVLLENNSLTVRRLSEKRKIELADTRQLARSGQSSRVVARPRALGLRAADSAELDVNLLLHRLRNPVF